MKTLNNVRLLPYSSASKGAKRLAEALGIVLLDRGNQTVNEGDMVINWGNSSSNLVKDHNITNWINTPEAVDLSIDKYHCFEALKASGVPVPAFFTEVNDAASHLLDGGHGIVIRNDVRGMNGEGIKYAFNVLELTGAPLYTAYFPHECEVRVHVVGGEVVELHDKTAAGFKGTASGTAYALTDEVRAMLSSTAIQAVSAVELDIAAVDILWSEDNQNYVVLEINTAPTMVNGTLVAYTNAIRDWLGEEVVVEVPKEVSASTTVNTAKASSVESSPKASSKASPKASAKASDEVLVSPQDRVEAILDGSTTEGSSKASPKASASDSKASPKASEAKASPKASVAPKASEYVDEASGDECTSPCTELMVLEAESVSPSEHEVVVQLVEEAVVTLKLALGLLNSK